MRNTTSPPMELDNRILNDLYDKIRQNNSKAFESLYHLMYKRLYSVANMILEYKELNEEVLEEVFTSLWVNRHKVTVENIFTYLYVLTKNKAIDTKRKEERWNYLTLEDVHDNLPCNSVTPETTIVSKEEVNLIYSIIKKLPEKRKNVLMLTKYHGLKIKEVAEILGISVKTVDNHLAAAIKDVLEAFQERGMDTGSRTRIMSWLL